MNDRILRIPRPAPAGFSSPFGKEELPVNIWFDTDSGLLVDSGYAGDADWLPRIERPETMVITHHHPDHDGGIGLIEERFGNIATVVADPQKAGHAMVAADGLHLSGNRYELIATPGHTKHHFSVFDHDRRALYAGDLILARGTPAAGPPDGSFSQYIASLERVIAMAPDVIYPGHGPAVGIEQAQWTLQHRLQRLDDVRELLAAGPYTPEQLVEQLYVEKEGMTLDGLRRMVAVMTMQGYLDVLEQRGAVHKVPEGYELVQR